MTVFKCKMCGGTIEFEEGASIGVCEYCGTKQTLPRLDDDRRASLFDRANHLRRNNDFDKAMGIYEQLLTEDPIDAEAYWSLVLCRYGIEYVEDPATHKRVPTVNRTQFTSIFDDDNYKSAIQYADTLQREIYEEEAKAINDIQKGILAISQKEEPYDVFICYKETDDFGRRTRDSVIANELYHQLTQEGFKVFFSRITLEDKLGEEYEPYIFSALNSAKVMVALGTKPEHFNAVWVKNEWSRFLSLVKQSGGKKILIPAFRDMDPYNLPEEFSHLQAQDMSKLGFMQDLIRGIKKIIDKDEPNGNGLKADKPKVNGPRVIDEAVERKRREATKKLKKAAAIAIPVILVCLAFIYILTSVIIPHSKYNEAMKLYNAGNYDEAIAAFEALDGYKDSLEQIEYSRTAIKDQQYDFAMSLYNAGNYDEAVAAFKDLDGYKDSAAQMENCYIGKLGEDKYNSIKNINVGDTYVFGAYEQDNNTSNGKEGIEWIVLDNDGLSLLLISKYCLDRQPFDASYVNDTWDACSLRKWLNETFINDAFSINEQDMIQDTNVTAVKYERVNNDESPGEDTIDKIFILSSSEIDRYLNFEGIRRGQGTSYCNGDRYGPYWDFDWWLRDSSWHDMALTMKGNGSEISSCAVSSDFIAVRPALWIDLGV